METQEYNAKVDAWGKETRNKLKANIAVMTNLFTGGLRNKLTSKVRIGRDDGEANAVGFRFLRHGAYVAYGVGRGYVRKGGQVVRGSKNPKTKVKSGPLARHPKDWFDATLSREINGLADVAGEYYGDKSAQGVLDELDRLTIVKKG